MNEAIPRSRRDVMGLLAGGLGLLAAAAAGIVGAGFLYPVPQLAPLPQFICLRSAISQHRPMELRDRAGRRVLLMDQGDGVLSQRATVKYSGSPRVRLNGNVTARDAVKYSVGLASGKDRRMAAGAMVMAAKSRRALIFCS